MGNIDDLQLGKAGEYIVCADLILQGYVAFPSEQGLSFDVVVGLGNSLVRVQVKTTRTYKAVPQRAKKIYSYLFNCRRCGKGGRRSYGDEDFDVMAFVCLDDKVIGYLPINEVRQTMQFRTRKQMYEGHKTGRYLEDLTFERSIKLIKRNGEIINDPS
jgi:hypothetical protein